MTTHAEQLTAHSRKMNGIQAFKIFGVEGKEIIVQLPREFGEGKTTEIPLSNEALNVCEVGMYVDLVFSFSVYGGEISDSYTVKFWGITPKQFIPTDGEAVGK